MTFPTTASTRRPLKAAPFLALFVLSLIQCGCFLTGAPRNTVPACAMPELLVGTRSCQVPIDLTLLGQTRPKEHLIGPGDTLSIYIHGILPTPEMPLAQMIQQTPSGLTDYYPPIGPIRTPPVGPSIVVSANGTLRLPYVGNVQVSGMTLDQAMEEILKIYREKQIIQPEHEKILINLTRPRVQRITIVREDSQTNSIMQLTQTGQFPFIKHGVGQVIDLPIYENDVLHALSASGGLPGLDAKSEVWILRDGQNGIPLGDLESRMGDEVALAGLKQNRQFVRIPLRVIPGQPLEFGPEDVVLNDGDVLFVPSRSEEVFYTGGLLQGGQIPLPRDKDVDIVEAMSLIGASVGSPAGYGGAVFAAGQKPGNLIPPTRGVIIRKLPNGEILAIRIDMHCALDDPSERIIVEPGDTVMLFYKPHQLVINSLANMVNFSFLIPTRW